MWLCDVGDELCVFYECGVGDEFSESMNYGCYVSIEML